MTRTDATVVNRQAVVNAPQAKAFAAFTGWFGDYEPPRSPAAAIQLIGAPT